MSAALPDLSYNTTRVTAAAYHTRVGLGFSRFVRHYYGNCLFSSGYLDVSVPPLASRCITHRVPTHNGRGLPHSEISGSACKRLPGAYRSVTTSFFGPGCLGIHHLPFLACMALLFSRLPPSAYWSPARTWRPSGRKKSGSLSRSSELSSTFLQRIHGHSFHIFLIGLIVSVPCGTCAKLVSHLHVCHCLPNSNIPLVTRC